MLETEKAWLAGYIDGDGCITVYKKTGKESHYVSMMVAIDSADPELLEEVSRIAGGNIITKKKYDDNHRQTYTWRLCGSAKIIALLRELLPYFRCNFKKGRAKLLVERWEQCTPGNGRYSVEQLQQKKELVRDIMDLGVGRGRRILLEGRLGTSEPTSL